MSQQAQAGTGLNLERLLGAPRKLEEVDLPPPATPARAVASSWAPLPPAAALVAAPPEGRATSTPGLFQAWVAHFVTLIVEPA